MNNPEQPDLSPDRPRPWLRWLCVVTLLATFALIAIGGKVTSYDYGMAIPRGFTTGGVISFLAPLEYWWGSVDKRWEHTHRIMGTLVGFLTIAMAVGLWRTQQSRPWLKRIGMVILGLVCLQGALGAMRVEEVSLVLAFVHGIVGQLILCSWVLVLCALGMPWLGRLSSITASKRALATPRLRWGVMILLVLLLGQLTLGAAVRHFKADKAIPDFPLVYGHVFPPMSQESLDEIYDAYFAARASSPTEAAMVTNRTPQDEIVVALSGVDLQTSHCTGAVGGCIAGLFVIVASIRLSRDRPLLLAPALVLLTLLAAQFSLGVMTVFTGTDPVVATLHQATGAALIAVATWLAVRIHLAQYPAVAADPQPSTSPQAHASAAPATTPATA